MRTKEFDFMVPYSECTFFVGNFKLLQFCLESFQSAFSLNSDIRCKFILDNNLLTTVQQKKYKRTFASNLLVCRSAAFTFCMPGAAFDSFSSNARCLWCLRFGLDFIVEAEVEAFAL